MPSILENAGFEKSVVGWSLLKPCKLLLTNCQVLWVYHANEIKRLILSISMLSLCGTSSVLGRSFSKFGHFQFVNPTICRPRLKKISVICLELLCSKHQDSSTFAISFLCCWTDRPLLSQEIYLKLKSGVDLHLYNVVVINQWWNPSNTFWFITFRVWNATCFHSSLCCHKAGFLQFWGDLSHNLINPARAIPPQSLKNICWRSFELSS